MEFYKCKDCGNIYHFIKDKSITNTCCSTGGEELVANISDGSGEKHVPVVTIKGNLVEVEVGSIPHPMIDIHYIEWIALETNKGFYIKYLNPMDLPKAEFYLEKNETVLNTYEHCNIHGLWKK